MSIEELRNGKRYPPAGGGGGSRIFVHKNDDP
jgi:hypothetical protein